MSRLVNNTCPNITSYICQQFSNVGVYTVIDFLLTDTEDLAKKSNIQFKEITRIRRALLETYASVAHRADHFFDEQISRIAILSTGSKRLDNYLYGGIYTGEITEIHGCSCSGKTQFCMCLAASIIYQSENTVLYIDTNDNFSAKRVKQVFSSKTKDKQIDFSKLKNIKMINIEEIYQFINTLNKIKVGLENKEKEFYKKLKLLVIDSITQLIVPCFASNHLNALGLMSNIIHQLNELCSKYQIAILVTNNTIYENKKIKPSLGSNWKYGLSVILWFHRIKSKEFKQRKIITVKSCHWVPTEDFIFTLSDDGIEK